MLWQIFAVGVGKSGLCKEVWVDNTHADNKKE
jgi:hypothetical protein